MASLTPLRLAVLAACCALPLHAQETQGQEAKGDGKPEQTVDAEKLRELEQQPDAPPAQDPVAIAKRQLEQMQKELAFIKQVADTGLVARVKARYLGDRSPAPRSLDLGVTVVPEPVAAVPAGPQGPRLMTDEEREKFGDGVVMLVEGQPVTKAEFDAMADYYKNTPGDVDAAMAEKNALRALVSQKAALARFQSAAPAAEKKIAELAKQLEGGEDFAAVAKANSMCPSAAQGGDLGSFGRNMMDPVFERAAFTTPVGEVSEPIQSAFGYHLVKVTAKDEDKGEVAASHILIGFDRNMQAVQQTMMAARQGRVDIAFVDADWKAKSPF